MRRTLKTLKKYLAQILSDLLRCTFLLVKGYGSCERLMTSVVIVAPLSHKNGISRGAEYQYQILRDSGIDVQLVDSSDSFRNPFFRAKHKQGSAYIFHCGGPQTSNMIWSVFPSVMKAYKIAYWAWELPDPAPDWKGFDLLVDEIWTPSEFSRASLSKLSKKPIFVVPHHIKAQPDRRIQVDRVFNVLSMADSRSSYSRKNPQGAIKAFRTAFGNSSAAHLRLKISGDFSDLQLFAKSHNIEPGGNITIISNRLNDNEMLNLYCKSDLFLSLHRSEGFGLPMLEAMSCGTPVIGTGWSGNMDFLNSANGVVIGYQLVRVVDDALVYGDSYWAEPDLDQAAAQLRYFFENRDDLEKISIACHKFVSMMKPSLPIISIG